MCKNFGQADEDIDWRDRGAENTLVYGKVDKIGFKS